MYVYIIKVRILSDVSYWPDGSPMALAQLSGESVNRSRLRRCGGLPLLVTAAKTNTHAMNALLQYVFDDSCKSYFGVVSKSIQDFNFGNLYGILFYN